MNDNFVLILAIVSLFVMIAALIGGENHTVHARPFFNRPAQELLLFALSMATLIGATLVRFFGHQHFDLGGFVMPTNAILLLLNSHTAVPTKDQA